jgi:formamidopyrimidine-DNA glycosylase
MLRNARPDRFEYGTMLLWRGTPGMAHSTAMPELPEVETVRQGLKPALEGARIAKALVRRRDLRIPVPADFARRLEGRQVRSIDRRGKYLLVHCEDALVLIIHLGMSGRLTIHAPGAPADGLGHFVHNGPPAGAPAGTHDHIELMTEQGTRIVYSDHRRFGLMTLTEADALAAHPLLKNMGPEPLDPNFTGAVLGTRLLGKETPLKAALLDQHVVAGLGNIYVCEALYRARLSPERQAGSLGKTRTARLVHAIQAVLSDAIKAGGSSLRDYAQADGSLGYFQHQFQVYGRAGEPCATPGCGATIRRVVQSNRSSFHCPRCQR